MVRYMRKYSVKGFISCKGVIVYEISGVSRLDVVYGVGNKIVFQVKIIGMCVMVKERSKELDFNGRQIWSNGPKNK